MCQLQRPPLGRFQRLPGGDDPSAGQHPPEQEVPALQCDDAEGTR